MCSTPTWISSRRWASSGRVPATLEEFEEISCAAGASDDYMGYPLDTGTSHFESFVAAHGGAIFDAMSGEYIFESDEVAAALSMFTRMLENNCAYLFADRYQNTGDFSRGITPFAARQLGWHPLHHLGRG